MFTNINQSIGKVAWTNNKYRITFVQITATWISFCQQHQKWWCNSYYCVQYDSMKELTPNQNLQHKVEISLLIYSRAINIGSLTLKITLICYSRSSINCCTVWKDLRGIFNQLSHLGIYQSASNPLMDIFIVF